MSGVVNPNITLICTATVAANAVAGSVVQVDMKENALESTVKEKIIPSNQEWIIEDIYVKATADAGTSDPQVQIVKNKTRIMAVTDPLSTLLVSNNSRPTLQQKFGFRRMEIITQFLITTIANDAVADAILFFEKVRVRPATR